MIGMKVRYEITDVSLKVSNVNPREAEEGYVLLRAYDENNNEIVFALSHEQAEHLQEELYEAHRRWKMSAASQQLENDANEGVFARDAEGVSH